MHLTKAPIWKRILAFIYDGLIVTALVLISGLIASLIAQGGAHLANAINHFVLVGRLLLVVLVARGENGRNASVAASFSRT